jgi:hypothetical protein
MRRIYNPCEPVHAGSVGPNPTGAAHMIPSKFMTKKRIIVEEVKFKSVLGQLVKTKPIPMKKIKTTGKRPKGSLFPKRSES